eukprot:CAMPEP_0183340574 /NCGR_PEP_ID=MMETSP0164_2-20130417/7082_1 /TAXON_ID=221442 /ORGANISM="Coccolithus pelagicus ssp braarudi, Strain PLY182g" /LENGTH=67 /DNA_ID=CAMNT_0025510735 /DNA_START=595 /DNA_END=794 /DNA_ORIENTATION=+
MSAEVIRAAGAGEGSVLLNCAYGLRAHAALAGSQVGPPTVARDEAGDHGQRDHSGRRPDREVHVPFP